jgi:hypothetical protein
MLVTILALFLAGLLTLKVVLGGRALVEKQLTGE